MPYIGRTTDGFGVRNRFVYLATSGDTSVSGADANGATLTFTDGAYVDVYLNGVLLKPTTDYNTSTANTIAGLSALNTNDEVTVVVYDVFTVADMVSATSGGTFSGGVTVGSTLDVTGNVSLDGGDFVFNESSADKDFRVESNGNTHMLFVDGGNDGVGIGTSSVDTASTLTVSNTSDAHGITIVGALNKSRMHFQGANTGSASTDGLVIGLSSSDDTNDDSAIIGLKESGAMSFQTANSTRLKLDGGGCLMLGYHQSGRTAPAYANRAFEAYSSTDNLLPALIHNKTTGNYPAGLAIVYDTSPDDQDQYAFYFVDGTTTRFYVFNDGDVRNHDNSYGAISDERIKQDIVDSNSQWNDIKNIKVRNFKRKDDVAQYGDKAWSQIGVVAQEVETVCPNIIRESNPTSEDIKMSSEFGTLYEDGDTIPEGKQIGDVKEIKSKVKSIGYSVLYMKAVKALQEAMVRIETLEAKVKALEEA